jgi:stage II sporulation protein P
MIVTRLTAVCKHLILDVLRVFLPYKIVIFYHMMEYYWSDSYQRGELKMHRRFKQKPQLGKCISVMLLVLVCLLSVGFVDFSYTLLLQSGLGGVGQQTEEQERGEVSKICEFLFGIDPFDPSGVLEKGLPFSITARVPEAVCSRGTSEQPAEKNLTIDKSQWAEALANKPVEVALYHTHNAETYIPENGKSKVEGKNGGITLVGEEIAGVLAEQGVRVVHDLTIHDYPDFPTSYIKSKATVNGLLGDYPDLKMLIDLHRDAGIPKKQTVTIDGEQSALLLFVVGNGQYVSNPHWRENYALARQVANRLQEKYPGIVKDVRLKSGGYNQNLSPNVLLVEVGSDKNTLDEALIAGRCLGEVLAELINEKHEKNDV